jgi:hypothetical protein
MPNERVTPGSGPIMGTYALPGFVDESIRNSGTAVVSSWTITRTLAVTMTLPHPQRTANSFPVLTTFAHILLRDLGMLHAPHTDVVLWTVAQIATMIAFSYVLLTFRAAPVLNALAELCEIRHRCVFAAFHSLVSIWSGATDCVAAFCIAAATVYLARRALPVRDAVALFLIVLQRVYDAVVTTCATGTKTTLTDRVAFPCEHLTL